MATPSAPEILGLLGDAVRWQIVVELGHSDRRVGELVALTHKPQNVVSYHLAELRRSGVVSARRSSADGRDVYYRSDLFRCRDLLADAGLALHPALALTPAADITTTAPTGSPAPTSPAATSSSASHRRGARHRPRLLFLCTGNSARSQIAEALAVHRSDGAVDARSAGSQPKPLHPLAVRVMAERGVDIAGNTTKPLTRFARNRFDRIITLCDKVREVCPEFPGSPFVAHWSMADPSATGEDDDERLIAFRRTADDIDGRLTLLLADLRIPRPEWTHHD